MPIQPHSISLGKRPIADYEPLAPAGLLDRARELARPLEGMRVVHLAPADPAGGAPEVLAALLPLLADVGISAEWRAVEGGPATTRVAHALAGGLRGAEAAIDERDWSEAGAAWAQARAAAADADVVVAHEPAGILAATGEPGPSSLLWRLHADSSSPYPPAWERVEALAGAVAGCVVPLAAFSPPGIPAHAIAPGIDPFGARSRELPVKLAGDALRALGIDLERPLCCQVGAVEAWGDAHAVIDAFRAARERAPGLQLVLTGESRASGGEVARLAGELADYSGGVEDLHVLTGYAGVGELELNALSLLARATIVASLGGDFALGASEALWKRTPVVAVTSPGVAAQVRDGVDGRLCEDATGLATALVEVVSDPALAIEMGVSGRERVRERFLAVRALTDELELLGSLPRGGASDGPGRADATVRP